MHPSLKLETALYALNLLHGRVMSIAGEFDGLGLAAAIVSECILLPSASACKLNLCATGSTARVRALEDRLPVERV